MKKICTALIIAVLMTMVFSAVTVHAASAISITEQPEDIAAPVGSTGSATVKVDGEVTYRWYFKSVNSSTWTPSGMKGHATATVYVPVTTARLGQQYKCIITDADGNTVETKAVTVRAADAGVITIEEQPADVKGEFGTTGSATVKATVSSNATLTYRWYFLAKGATEWKASGFVGSRTPTIFIPVAKARVGQQYKCVIKSSEGVSVTSDVITVREPDPAVVTIVTEPEDITAKLGENGTATVAAENDKGVAMTYRWYFLAKGATEWRASGFTGSRTATITVPVASSRVGQQYKCVITTADGGYAETRPVAVKPFVTNITVNEEPSDLYAAFGESATATVAASGDSASALTYRWYFLAKGATEWKASGFTGSRTATITVPVTKARVGQQYKCVITTADGGRAETAPVTVLEKPELDFSITRDPDSYRMYAGDPVDLHVTVSVNDAKYPVKYEWYKDGAKVEGANEARLFIASYTASDEGDYYCVASCCGYTAVSRTATVRTLG